MSAAPNPNKLLLLGVLGVAVFLYARRASAAATVVTPATAQAGTAGSLLGSITKALGSLGGLVSGTPSASAVAAGAAVGAANAVSDANYAGANWAALASSGVDGIAQSVPSQSTYDAANATYASDDPAAWWN